MIILLDEEKASDKIQHFQDKSSGAIRDTGTYLNIVNTVYCKPIASINLNWEKSKEFY